MRSLRITRGVVAGAAAMLLVACAPASTPAPDTSRPPSTQVVGPMTWEQLPSIPDGPRGNHTIVWTGDEIVVLGGSNEDRCPDTASCALDPADEVRTAWALDVEEARWRELESPPEPLLWAAAVHLDGVVYTWSAQGTLLAYDVQEDSWRVIADNAGWLGTAAAFGESLVLCGVSDEIGDGTDRMYDTVRDVWSDLPDDPIGPAFGRVCTATPYGIVLTARELVASPSSNEPALVLAALWDGTGWTRLQDTEQIGGWTWTWTGERLVAPELGSEDGGAINGWDRVVPFGGAITLPDGTWSALEGAPEPRYPTWVDDAPGGRWSTVSGYLYDDTERTWTVLDRPDGAPTGHARSIWADGELYLVGGDDDNTYVDTVYRGTPAD